MTSPISTTTSTSTIFSQNVETNSKIVLEEQLKTEIENALPQVQETSTATSTISSQETPVNFENEDVLLEQLKKIQEKCDSPQGRETFKAMFMGPIFCSTLSPSGQAQPLLHLVLSHRYLKIVAFLVGEIYNKYPKYRDQVLFTRNGLGETPLHLALEIGLEEPILPLMEQTSVQVFTALLCTKNLAGQTPLHVAARCNRPTLLSVILSLAPDTSFKQIFSATNSRGENPLYVATRWDSIEFASSLLESLLVMPRWVLDAVILGRSHKGYYSFHPIVCLGYEKIASILIPMLLRLPPELSTQVFSAVNGEENNTLLNHAMNLPNNIPTIKALLKALSKFPFKIVNQVLQTPNCHGSTPLTLVMDENHSEPFYDAEIYEAFRVFDFILNQKKPVLFIEPHGPQQPPAPKELRAQKLGIPIYPSDMPLIPNSVKYRAADLFNEMLASDAVPICDDSKGDAV